MSAAFPATNVDATGSILLKLRRAAPRPASAPSEGKTVETSKAGIPPPPTMEGCLAQRPDPSALIKAEGFGRKWKGPPSGNERAGLCQKEGLPPTYRAHTAPYSGPVFADASFLEPKNGTVRQKRQSRTHAATARE